jgi:alpha-1,6-mannosyltransferase
MSNERHLFLAAPGLAILALELAGLHFLRRDALAWFIGAALAQGAIYFVAAFWVVGRRPSPLGLILLFAVLLRLPPLLSPPSLSTDVYRYVWDGRVQAAGINPYRYVPAAPELKSLRDDRIHPNINRREYAVTIYPPAAQIFFLAATRVSESVTWMKASILACEGLLIWLLLLLLRQAGRPDAELLLYVWHPLAIWEFAGSGHVDAAAIACLLAALLARGRGRSALAGAALGLAALFKLYPLVLFPALWRPRDWRMPLALAATIAVGYLPYLGVGWGVLGFLPAYVREEGLQSGSRYYLLQLAESISGVQLSPAFYLVPAGLALAALSIWVCLRRQPEDGVARGSVLLATAAVLAFSPHYAWYFAWLLPLAALTSCMAVLLLGVTSFSLYWFLLAESASTVLYTGSLIFLPFALLLLFRAPRTTRTAEGAHVDAAR